MKTTSFSKLCLSLLVAAPFIAGAQILTPCAQFTALPNTGNSIDINTIAWDVKTSSDCSGGSCVTSLNGYSSQNDTIDNRRYGWAINVAVTTPTALSPQQTLQLVNESLNNLTGNMRDAVCWLNSQSNGALISVNYACTGANCNT